MNATSKQGKALGFAQPVIQFDIANSAGSNQVNLTKRGARILADVLDDAILDLATKRAPFDRASLPVTLPLETIRIVSATIAADRRPGRHGLLLAIVGDDPGTVPYPLSVVQARDLSRNLRRLATPRWLRWLFCRKA